MFETLFLAIIIDPLFHTIPALNNYPRLLLYFYNKLQSKQLYSSTSTVELCPSNVTLRNRVNEQRIEVEESFVPKEIAI